MCAYSKMHIICTVQTLYVSHACSCLLDLDSGIFYPIQGYQGATISLQETPGLGMSDIMIMFVEMSLKYLKFGILQGKKFINNVG